MSPNSQRMRRAGPGRYLPCLTATALLWCATVLDGCGRDDGGVPVVAPDAASVALLQPVDGDTVAGSVRIEAGVRGGGVAGLVFLVDGAPLDTLTEPPWAIEWNAGYEEARRTIGIRETSGHQGQDPVAGDEAVVQVIPDLPPVVSIEESASSGPAVRNGEGARAARERSSGPGSQEDASPEAFWLEQTPTAALSARAIDPEEGPLTPDRIRWTSDAAFRAIPGQTLPLELLSREEQLVTAIAVDRWGLSGSAEVRVRPYRIEEPGALEGTLHNLEAAVMSRRAGILQAMLDSAMVFVPCRFEAERARWPSIWPRVRVAAALPAALARTGPDSFRWIGSPRIQASWIEGDDPCAWVCWEATGGTMQILLGRRDGAWRILEWRDLASGDRLSLGSILAVAAGDAAAPAGLGCLRPAPA